MNLKDIELGKKIWEEVHNRSGGSSDLTYIGEFVRNLFEKHNFQHSVKPWITQCFGDEIAANIAERNHRFLEEAIELVQSLNCTEEEAHQLVRYVFNRPIGEPNQEVGGVMITLAALCLANGLNMHKAGDEELNRVWKKIDLIREKQKSKPPSSPLPGGSVETDDDIKFKNTLKSVKGKISSNFNFNEI